MQQYQLDCLNNGDAMGYSEVGTQSLNLMFQIKTHLLQISSWYRLILHLSKIDISIVIARIHLKIYRAFLIVYLMFWEQAISTW